MSCLRMLHRKGCLVSYSYLYRCKMKLLVIQLFYLPPSEISSIFPSAVPSFFPPPSELPQIPPLVGAAPVVVVPRSGVSPPTDGPFCDLSLKAVRKNFVLDGQILKKYFFLH